MLSISESNRHRCESHWNSNAQCWLSMQKEVSAWSSSDQAKGCCLAWAWNAHWFNFPSLSWSSLGNGTFAKKKYSNHYKCWSLTVWTFIFTCQDIGSDSAMLFSEHWLLGFNYSVLLELFKSTIWELSGCCNKKNNNNLALTSSSFSLEAIIHTVYILYIVCHSSSCSSCEIKVAFLGVQAPLYCTDFTQHLSTDISVGAL